MVTRADWSEIRQNALFCASLGQVLKDLREPRSQEALAAEASIHLASVQRLEQGRLEEVSLRKLAACASVLGTTADDLITRAKTAPSPLASMPIPMRGFVREPPIGRESDKEGVVADLINSRGVVLFGAPGQGKTTLARYVAATLAGEFKHGVCEVDLESERQIQNLPRLIATALGQPDLPSSYELLRGRSLLLVLDSVDLLLQHSPPAHFRDALSAITRALSSDGRVIITCQSKLEKQELITREVLPLRDDAALELFHQMSDGQYRQDSTIDVAQFVRDQLAGHPLSIKIVARYGRSVPLPLDDLRRLWGEKWSAVAEGSPTALDDRGLRASFELTFEALADRAKLLFLSLGLLPDGMPPALIKDVWPDGETGIYGALRTLRDRSLLDEQDGYSTPTNRLRGPLFLFAAAKRNEFQRADSRLRQQLEEAAAGINEWFDRYIAANAPQFGDSDPRQKNQLIREQFHNIHASLDRRLEPSTAPATLAAAEGVLSLYWAYHNNLSGARNPISSTEDAIRYLEKAHRIFVGNNQSAEATRCIYYIGNIHWLRGDVPKAQTYLQEAEGSDSVSLEIACEIQRAFAHIEYKEGDIRVAVERFNAVIARAKDYKGCISRCWVGLFDAYRKLERFEDGFKLMASIEPCINESAIEVRANLRRGHAYLLATAGRHDEAAREYQHALAAFAHNDFGQAHCWRGIGDIHVHKSEFDEADAAFETAMRLYDDARKNPSLGVALVMLGRGRLAQATGRFDDALRQFREVAQLLDREHLNEPYELAVAHELIGAALAATGDAGKANAELGIASSYFAKVGATAVADRINSKLAEEQARSPLRR